MSGQMSMDATILQYAPVLSGLGTLTKSTTFLPMSTPRHLLRALYIPTPKKTMLRTTASVRTPHAGTLDGNGTRLPET